MPELETVARAWPPWTLAAASLIAVASLMPVGSAHAQASDTIGRGLGSNGPLNIAAGDANRVVSASDYSFVQTNVAAGATTIAVNNGAGFSAGNAIMVVQTQVPTDVADSVPDPDPIDLATLEIGHFELIRVASVSGNTITLETPLAGTYVAPGAQIVRVREYTSVSVAAGRSLSAFPWDGRRGGIIAFVATGTVTIAGAVHADGVGFRGGRSSDSDCLVGCASPPREVCSSPSSNGTGRVGEGLEYNTMDGMPADDEYGDQACGTGNRDLGGGGGGNPRAGGGGGGHGGMGGNAGSDDSLGGSPGSFGAALSMNFPSRVAFGGGGGGGQTTVPLSGVGNGETGGGAVFIHGRRVVVLSTGRISADGRDGADVSMLVGGQAQGGGGGGAGGMVLVIVGDEIDCTSAQVRADGGDGGSFETAATAGGGGGGGGGGRVCLLRRVDTCNGLVRGGAGGTGLSGGVTVLTARDGDEGVEGPICEGPSPDCATSLDCALVPRPICNTVNGLCDPCTTDAQCIGRDPSAPRCVTSGPRIGECVPCLVGSGAADCDDSNECTSEVCDATLSCVITPLPVETICSTGFCNGSAVDPRCQMCTRDEHCPDMLTCNTMTGTCRCTNDAQCNDGNECTIDDCASGSCSITPVPTDTMCSGGYCNGAAVPPRCQMCTRDEHCDGALTCNTTTGMCRCLIDVDCDDGNDCTADSCDAEACMNEALPAGTVCMGGFCNGSTTDPRCQMCIRDEDCPGALTCNLATGTCRCAGDADCDDGNDCTADACNAEVCANIPVPMDTVCEGGFCNVTPMPPRCQMCNRDDQCPGGLMCNPVTGACMCNTDSDCEDGNSCTVDRCEASSCVRTSVPAGDPCQGEAGVCNANRPIPMCVECVDDADCPDGRCMTATGMCESGFDGGIPPEGGATGGGGCAVSAPSTGSSGRGGLIALLMLLALAFVRRRRGASDGRTARATLRGMGGALLVGALSFPALGSAQTVALDRFGAGETPEDDFAVSRPTDLGHLRWGAQLYGNYALNPLVYEAVLGDAGTEEFAIVENQLNLTLGLSLGLFDRLVIYAGLPISVLNDGDDPALAMSRGLGAADGAGLGDAYLGARVRFFGEPEDAFVLGAQATLTMPTAAADATSYRGEDHVTFHGEVLAAIQPGLGSRIVLNVGARAREEDPQAGNNFQMRHELTYALGVAIPVWTDEGDPNTHFDVSAQVFGATAFAFAFDRNYTSLEGNLGLRFFHGSGVVVGAAAGPGLARGIGTPDVRAIFSLAYHTPRPSDDVDTDGDGIVDRLDQCPTDPEDLDGFEDEDGCPENDNDRDGILDSDDECPNEPETVNDFEDEDGCPDEVGDRDGDRILDNVDECPDTPEDHDGFQDEDGCPDLDNDEDGIVDASDACPNVAGPLENRGCPDADRDGDTVIDRLDNCPDEPGPPENQGCAEEQQVIIQSGQLRITDAVYFDTARATIQERSFGLLLNVARVIAAHPEITRVVIEGHTDRRGTAEYNLRLSQERADAVRLFLIEQGRIDAGRLVAQGFGFERPIVENASSREELAQNRRVEFRIPSGEDVTTTTTPAP